jgi:hypothetical protein
MLRLRAALRDNPEATGQFFAMMAKAISQEDFLRRRICSVLCDRRRIMRNATRRSRNWPPYQ